MIEALHKKELTSENKKWLLHTTMELQLLNEGIGNELDFKLRPSYEIKPLLPELFGTNTDFQRRALDFVIRFTDCE